VRVVPFGDRPRTLQPTAPPWLGADWSDGSGVAPADRRQAEVPRLSGRVLADVGLAAPLLLPAQALVLHLRAV
jgi:alpha-galactosidase